MPTSEHATSAHHQPMSGVATPHIGASLMTRLLPIIFAAAFSTELGAQGTGSLSAGLARIRYDDTLSVTAATIEPTLRYDSGQLSLLASGTYAQLSPTTRGASSWTSQGELAGSVFTSALGALRGEIVGRAGMSAHEDGTRTGEWQALGRAHLMRAARGAWFGGGGGRTWDGASWREVRAADAGAWLREASAMLVATAAPTSITIPATGPIASASVRYTDVELSARWTPGRVELGGTFGLRAGDATVSASDERTWGSGTATIHLTRRLMLAGSAGAYPVDFAQGFPGGRYVSVSLGIAPSAATSGWEGAGAVRSSSATEREEEAPSFTVDALPSGVQRLRLRAPSAARVEVAGDFTAWQPMELRRASGGWWEATLRVPAGTHEISVRVDGGTWGAPPGLPVMVDELGGRTGLLVVH